MNGGYCIISMREDSKLRVYKLTIAFKKSMPGKNSKVNIKSLLIKIEKICSLNIFLNFYGCVAKTICTTRKQPEVL